VLVIGVGQVKSASIERAYRNTQSVAASVLTVSANRIASVRYQWAGKSRIGRLDVSTSASIDSGDRLELRASDSGRRLQLDTPFYAAMYPWTAVGLTLIALVIGMSARLSPSGRSRQPKRWLPAELRRPRRRS
jgi:heme exporter protein D